MAQKIRPTSLRLGLSKDWESRWFTDAKKKRYFLEEDLTIRRLIGKQLKDAGISKIEIERTANSCRVNIWAMKPGFIIGRGGKGIEELTKKTNREVSLLRKRNAVSLSTPINLSVLELPRNEISAQVTAQSIAIDLEKRYKFRRTIKKYLDEIMSHREVKGAKIMASGRLDGAEIARREKLMSGTLPLSNLRANIDYGEATAFTTYGTVGIKVWMNKGEVFSDRQRAAKKIGD
jgi:small subunit ribosomal protein S3